MLKKHEWKLIYHAVFEYPWLLSRCKETLSQMAQWRHVSACVSWLCFLHIFLTCTATGSLCSSPAHCWLLRPQFTFVTSTCPKTVTAVTLESLWPTDPIWTKHWFKKEKKHRKTKTQKRHSDSENIRVPFAMTDSLCWNFQCAVSLWKRFLVL